MFIANRTLPRDGTDLVPTRVVLREVDPTLPRDGTDFIATSCEEEQARYYLVGVNS